MELKLATMYLFDNSKAHRQVSFDQNPVNQMFNCYYILNLNIRQRYCQNLSIK